MVKRAKILKKRSVTTETRNDSAQVGNFSSGYRFPKLPQLPVVVTVALVLLVSGVILGVLQHNHLSGAKPSSEIDFMNEALQNNDKALALEHAKQALAKDPHNIDTILAVANIDKVVNPTEAKQYFKQALAELKLQDNPDVSNKPAATYWAAAQLADQAGEKNQAKKYYQEVIDAINTAKSVDTYSQSLTAQSQAALKRLQ